MKRFLWVIVVFALALGVAAMTYSVSFQDAVDNAQRDDRERLEIFSELISATVNRYRTLPFSVARNRTILRLLEGRASVQEANLVLKEIAKKSKSSAVYILSPSGDTLAASNFDTPISFVGKNYSFRQYFKEAIQGKEGAMYAIGTTSAVPGYYLSCPVELDDSIVGVAVAKLELLSLQTAWHIGQGTVLAADPYGVAILSSNSKWVYRSTHPLPTDELSLIRNQKLYPGKSLTPLFSQVYSRGSARWARVDDHDYLLVQKAFPEMGWNLFYLTSHSSLTLHSMQLSAFTFLICLVGMTIFLFVQEHRRNTLAELRLEQSRRTSRIDNEREESLRLLADSIAHQIRNPLLGIGGNANLLRKKLPHDDRLEYHLFTIIDCCHNLERIVVSIRDYINLVPGPAHEFSMGDAVNRARLDAEIAIEPQNIVNWSLSIEPARLRLDESLLVKALVEILKNALEYADKNTPAIRIHGHWKGKACTFRSSQFDTQCYFLHICDNGQGIVDEVLKHVMDPFFTTKTDAVGLGLTKAKRVLQVFHGTIEVFSSPDQSSECCTEVVISIPIEEMS